MTLSVVFTARATVSPASLPLTHMLPYINEFQTIFRHSVSWKSQTKIGLMPVTYVLGAKRVIFEITSRWWALSLFNFRRIYPPKIDPVEMHRKWSKLNARIQNRFDCRRQYHSASSKNGEKNAWENVWQNALGWTLNMMKIAEKKKMLFFHDWTVYSSRVSSCRCDFSFKWI